MRRRTTARRRAPRGQAVVELALGTLVLVTILVVGIYFAEYGFLWVKLEETANFALFDQTNARMHDAAADDWNKWFAGGPGASVAPLNTRVHNRYQDFNGLSSVTGAPTVTQVFARASSLSVDCARYVGPRLDMNAAGDTAKAAYGKANQENAGVSCQVAASLTTNARFPKHFADGADGKFFKVKTLDKLTSSPTACAAGRPSGGDCSGRGFRMLLDDWGFQGVAEGGQCPLSNTGCPDNPGYWRMAKATFDAAGGSDGSDATTLAQGIVGFSPADETQFWMSFRGEDSPYGPFTESHPSDGDTDWPTTPYDDPNSASTYKPAHGSNDQCFLGWKC